MVGELGIADENEKEWLQPETTSILFFAMSKEHIHLLEHPVITTFLYMKWKSIEQFYYMKFPFVVLFMAILHVYIFVLNEKEVNQSGDSSLISGFFWTTLVLLIIFSLRELAAWPSLLKDSVARLKKSKGSLKLTTCKALGPLGAYLSIPENSLRILLIISTYLLLFVPKNKTEIQELSSVTILLSWVYGLFFTANFPGIAIYATMLTTVSKNFFKILLWLFWFVFAFSLTFFFLLHSTEKDEDGNKINSSFSSVKESVLKTIVMVFTGEIDFGSISFPSAFGKFVFLLFVFFIMLVFMNLLNGLAISDINIIQKESEVNTQIARMKIICNYEALCLSSTALQKYGGFALISNTLNGCVARFEFDQKEKLWTCLNSPEVPTDMLDTAKSIVFNQNNDDGEEVKESEMKILAERITRIEATLDKILVKLS